MTSLREAGRPRSIRRKPGHPDRSTTVYPRRIVRFILLGALASLVTACKDVVGPEPSLQPGFHPVLVRVASTGETAVTGLALDPVQVPDRIAALQGLLEYDTTAVRLVGATLTGGEVGSWREVSPGAVRFAVVSPGGFGAEPLLRLQWTGTGALDARWFTIRFETAVSADFGDLRSRIVGAGALSIRDP
jgi:hypothetical protein